MTQQGQGAPPTQGRSANQPRSSPRAGGRAPRADGRSLTDSMGVPAVGRKVTSTSAPTAKLEKAVVTEGRSGERNLSILWVDVWIGNSKPCRFDVATRPGHALEVVVEQQAYRRVYTGSGSVGTQPVPVAPLGTTFTVRATDTTTGETVEQSGVWYDMGTSFWQRIKRLFWKG